MAEKHNLLRRVEHLDAAPQMSGYSKVVIHCGTDNDGNEIVYQAGNDTGKTLDIRNDWGSQEQANDILAQIRGYQYQPYEATNALIDPCAELGDGVSANGIYSGIYVKATQFDALCPSDLKAPYEEEIEHEFVMSSPTDRTYSRFVRKTSAMISMNATQIEAKVSKTSENGTKTFGWILDDDSWTIKANSKAIFQANKDGIIVNGSIRSGKIGDDASDDKSGFIITKNAIHNNMPSMDSTNTTGVYIGTNGIKIGQNFSVSAAGTITAKSATLGSLKITSKTDSSGKTTTSSSYSGSLSGCGGSLNNINLGGTTTVGEGKDAEELYNYVGNIAADKIAAHEITADEINSAFGTTKELSVSKFKFGGNTIKNASAYIESLGQRIYFLQWADPMG